MSFVGEFMGISPISANTYILSLQVGREGKRVLDRLKESKQLSIDIKKYRPGRSLDANSYYWVLATKLSEINRISVPRQHNLLLRRYGQPALIADKLVRIPIPDTDEAENNILESEHYHIRPTTEVREGKDGITYRTYTMIRGSSTYDTKEMARLIDGLISECRDVEMSEDEIMTENQKRELRQKWGLNI